jgi:phosphate-selective porin OprO and OprP
MKSIHQVSFVIGVAALSLTTLPALAQQSTPPPAVPVNPAGAPAQGPEAIPAPTPPAVTDIVPATPPLEPKPAEPKPAEPAKPEHQFVSFKKGLRFDAGDEFEATLSLRTQFRAETLRDTKSGGEFQSKFSIPRARLQLEGHVHSPHTLYKLELALGDRGSFSFVKDLWVEQKLGSVRLRAGQWKRPFNRQELVSDFAGAFNERAITAEFVGGGRDLGLAIHNNYEKSAEGVEWVVGVFNGFSGGGDRPQIATTCTQDAMTMAVTCKNAAASTVPSDFGPTLIARAGYNSGDVKGYSEGDIEGGSLRFGVAANYKVDLANFDGSKVMSHGVGADFIIKVEGFDAIAGVYGMKIKGGDFRLGGFAQTGYFVTPKKLQVSARFAVVQEAEKAKQLEGRVGLNLLAKGHALKLVNDIGFLKTTGEANKPRLEARSMIQLTF